MNKRFILLLVLFSALTTSGYCQKAPGYMGKRLSIGANFQAGPALFNPNKNENSGFFKFNTQIGATIEYTTNRHASILAHYQVYSTKKDYKEEELYNLISRRVLFGEIFGNIDVTSYGFEYRRYSNSIAPFGFYTGIGVNYKSIIYTQPTEILSPQIINSPVNDSPYSLLSLGLSIGKQRIYFNRLIVSTGLNFIIPLEFGKLDFFKLEENDPYDLDESADVYKRVALHDLVNFKIGARFLLF